MSQVPRLAQDQTQLGAVAFARQVVDGNAVVDRASYPGLLNRSNGQQTDCVYEQRSVVN